MTLDERINHLKKIVLSNPVLARVLDELERMPEPRRLPTDLVEEGHTIPVARVVAMHEGKRRKRAAEQD